MTLPQIELDIESGLDSDSNMADTVDTVSVARDAIDIADRSHNLLDEDIMTDVRFQFKKENLFDYAEPTAKILSEPSEIFGGCSWRLLIFPRGNNNNNDHMQMSVFLECSKLGEITPNWSQAVFFSLALNSIFPEKTIVKDSHHVFQSKESDWGFSQFASVDEAQNPNNGFIVDGMYTFEARVILAKGMSSVWSGISGYNSKKATGCVGLKNQGATCYMNSMLQALFFTNKLRKAVYNLPSNETDTSVSLALQRVFFDLQTLDVPVGTTQLTKSFGWNTAEAFMQHDVQEFNRVLCDNLESKMKGTPSEGTIASLFEGKMKSYVKCINVDYESSRLESFYDIQLVVKDKKSLYDSFDEYVVEETLDGDNKYLAEGYGLRDAKKGCVFEKLPPVLHLQLRRFEYDIEADCMVKINDRHEFEERINLDKYLDKAEATPADYTLYAVTNVSTEEALEGNFGVDKSSGLYRFGNKGDKTKKFTNAYMLVYIRDSCINEVMLPVAEDDMRGSLREQLLNEREQHHLNAVALENAHKYATFNMYCGKDLATYRGFNLIGPDTNMTELKVHKASTVGQFLNQASEVLRYPPRQMRFWKFVPRQNGTLRPHAEVLGIGDQDNRLITDIENWRAIVGTTVKVFVEVPPRGQTELPEICIHEKQENRSRINDDVLVFFKYYNPAAELKLIYVGFEIHPKGEPICCAEPFMRAAAGLPENTELIIFEEIQPNRIDLVDPTRSFRQGEILSGDILTFQIKPSGGETGLKWPLAKDYYDYMYNRIEVSFKNVNERSGDREFTLELLKNMTYDEVARHVADALPTYDYEDRCDPMTLRFYQCELEKRARPIVRAAGEVTLDDMVKSKTVNPSCTLYYENMDVNIVELESKVPLTLWWQSANGEEVEQKLLLEHGTTIEHILSEQRRNPSVKLSPGGTGKLRLVEIFDHKIVNVYSANHANHVAEDIRQEEYKIRMEEIPADQVDTAITEEDRMLCVVHFHREPKKLHGNPFIIVVREGEKLGDLKERLRIASHAKAAEFEKWKIALLDSEGYSKPQYLNDDDVITDILLNNRHEQRIGLDHPGRPSNYRSNDGQTGAVVIRN
eukprot:CFRG3884T1